MALVSVHPRGIRAEVADGRLGPPPERGAVDPGEVADVHERDRAAVAAVLSYYQVDAGRMVVAHDELDIDPGQLRVKLGGGDNGHNGLRSIRAARHGRVLPGPDRRRSPAWPPGPSRLLAEQLSRVSAREAVAVEVNRAADAVESLVLVGLDKTQSAFNN